MIKGADVHAFPKQEFRIKGRLRRLSSPMALQVS
jgi:hypothetical protein